MTKLYILIGIILAVGVILKFIGRGVKRKGKYHYKQKDFFMTRAEHECFDALVVAVGDKYHIFPQAHLPSIVDYKVKDGQYWKAALSHIDRKSVDFVLCDKAYISPKLAIELDDRTHKHPDRVERDREVERVLKEAGLSLLRLENHGHFNTAELTEKIREKVK